MDLLPNPLSFVLFGLSLPCAAGVVFGFIGVMTAPASQTTGRRERRSAIAFFVANLVALISVFIATFVASAFLEQRRTEWLASQGVTEADLPRLGFPVSAPHEDEIFGTSPALVDGRSTQVRLAWEGGDFVVYEVTGDRLLSK